MDWLEQKILAEMPHTDGLAVCGTFPPGVPDDFYARIIRQAIEARIPVLLDSFARIHETLQNPVDILKINRHELQEITGVVQIKKAMTLLFRQYPVRKLAITDG